MEDIAYKLTTALGVLVFTGFWVWFLYMIFSFMAERYEKKPLQYVSINKDKKIKSVNNMTKKSFFGYFKNLYEGRITRSVWFFGLIVLIVAFYASITIPFLLIDVLPEGISWILGILMIFVFVYYIIHVFSLHARRLHDLGYSDWTFLLIFVPIANLILLLLFAFAKGENKPNKFGAPVKNVKFWDAFFNKQSPISINPSVVEDSKSYCTKCGSLVESDSNFCIKCGNKINK